MKKALVLAAGVAVLLSGCNSETQNNGVQAETLTVNSVDDLKGYTLKTNEATTSQNGTSGSPYTVTLTVDCEGHYTYSDTKETKRGDAVSLEGLPGAHMITWGNVNDNSGGYLMLGTDDKLIAGQSCWFDSKTLGETCSAGLYIKSIIHDKVCQ